MRNIPEEQTSQPYIYVNTVKAKAIPSQAWASLEGSRRLRLPDFKTIST